MEYTVPPIQDQYRGISFNHGINAYREAVITALCGDYESARRQIVLERGDDVILQFLASLSETIPEFDSVIQNVLNTVWAKHSQYIGASLFDVFNDIFTDGGEGKQSCLLDQFFPERVNDIYKGDPAIIPTFTALIFTPCLKGRNVFENNEWDITTPSHLEDYMVPFEKNTKKGEGQVLSVEFVDGGKSSRTINLRVEFRGMSEDIIDIFFAAMEHHGGFTVQILEPGTETPVLSLCDKYITNPFHGIQENEVFDPALHEMLEARHKKLEEQTAEERMEQIVGSLQSLLIPIQMFETDRGGTDDADESIFSDWKAHWAEGWDMERLRLAGYFWAYKQRKAERENTQK